MKHTTIIVVLLLALLLCVLPMHADISFVNQCTGASSCSSVPTHAIGDLFIAYAGVNGLSTPAITLPTGWTSLGTQSLNGTGGADGTVLAACKVATSTSETVTGFGGGAGSTATHLSVLIYRGQLAGLTAACASSILSNRVTFTSTVNTAPTTATYPALTNTSSQSWNVGMIFATDATNADVAPTGMTNRSSINVNSEVAGHDTNGPVASWSSTNVTMNGGTRIFVIVLDIQVAASQVSSRMTLLGVGP